jgi:hypothetical protein
MGRYKDTATVDILEAKRQELEAMLATARQEESVSGSEGECPIRKHKSRTLSDH